MASSLEGDGVLDSFYEYLWRKHSESDSLQIFSLPDTVIFKYQQPSAWYFTSVDGSFKRKAKDKLNPTCIEEAFLKNVSPCEIVATYYCAAQETPEERTLEFLGRDELRHFLHYRKKTFSGILQRFIEPKGRHNEQIKVVWSPFVCIHERRQNMKNLYDTRFDPYERGVTFEGSDFHTKILPMNSPMLVQSLNQASEAIVKHISIVSDQRIRMSRMVLIFKQDYNERLWLLNASCLRVASEFNSKPVNLTVKSSLPETVDAMKVSTSPQNPVSMQKTVICKACDRPTEHTRMCELSYKFLLGRDAPETAHEVLRRFHPKMTQADYERYRYDSEYAKKFNLVCDECYLELTKSSLTSGVVLPRPAEAAVKQLMPSKTSWRREMTRASITHQSDRPKRLKSVASQVIRPVTAAGGELLMPLKSNLPRVPSAPAMRQTIESNLKKQKSLALMLGGADIGTFLEEYYSKLHSRRTGK
jgi:hypothetical protein